MAKNINNKKALAEQIKAKLNSPDYVAMPDLITYDNRYGKILAFLWGSKVDGNIHKKGNWINGKNINPSKGNKHESEHMVEYGELEKNDWEEIVNLIKKRNKEKEQMYDKKREDIKKKLNSTPNLYYRFSNSKRISTSYFTYPDKYGEYFNIWGVENGREYFLNININHPVLNNFPWEKNGYYLVETDKKIERNDKFGRPWSDYGESNPNNFHKWVEVGDKITITPYEVAADKPRKKDNSKVNNQIVAGESKNNHKNTKKDIEEVEKNKTIEWITQYFKDNRIKEINLVDNELVITNDNNQTFSSKDNHELQNITSQLEKNLKLEELQNLLSNSNSSSSPTSVSPKKDYTPYLVGGVVGIGITTILIVGFCLWKSRNDKENKNK